MNMNEPELELHPGEHGRVITIFGVRYDIELFRHLGIGPIGSRIELINRTGDGTVTLRRLPDKPHLSGEAAQAAVAWLRMVAEPSNITRSKQHAILLLQILEVQSAQGG